MGVGSYRAIRLTCTLNAAASATTQDSFARAGVHKYQEYYGTKNPAGPVLASANKAPPGTTTCAGRPSFARGGGSRRQLDLSAHTWRWAHREKKRREMPHVHQGSYGPSGADNMPRTAGAKRPTAALACLRRERPQRRNRSARRCARRMRSSQSQSLCPTRSLTRALTGARCVSFAQLW